MALEATQAEFWAECWDGVCRSSRNKTPIQVVVYGPLGKSHGTDRLSRNFGTELPTYAIWHPKRQQASVALLRKPEISLNSGMVIEAGSCQLAGFEGDTFTSPKTPVSDASRHRLAVHELTRRNKSSGCVFLLKQWASHKYVDCFLPTLGLYYLKILASVLRISLLFGKCVKPASNYIRSFVTSELNN